jgi:octaprenyl-diphosphate synthase
MSIDLKTIFAEDLSAVSRVITDSIESKEILVEDIGAYLFGAGGKRIRPILTILFSKICGYTGAKHIFLAAAVELIHAATLLHDDVVDESSIRRSMPTANFKWGNKASILVGDFLFSQSFKLMVSSESMVALQSLAHASSVIAEGEVMQLARLYENEILSIEQYEDIARSKTAALFGASTHVGAIIASQPTDICNAAKEYGDIIGLMFQIKDDMLDYFADPKDIGKNVGDDLAQGSITLPIILAYNIANAKDKKDLENYFFESKDRSLHFDDIVRILYKYDVKQQIASYIDTLAQKATKTIEILPYSNEYTQYLHHILDYVVGRNS